MGDRKFKTVFSGDVIGFNTKVGSFECSLNFEVIGKQNEIIDQPLPTSKAVGENLE